jgi:hypothetical protein
MGPSDSLSDYLNEWIFLDSGSGLGQLGPLSQQKYVAHEDTKLAAYWPHIVYQGMGGEIRGVHYACHEENECWHERVFDTTTARNGTQLVATPLQNDLSSLGLFYQEEGGRVLEYAENKDAEGSLWENCKRTPPSRPSDLIDSPNHLTLKQQHIPTSYPQMLHSPPSPRPASHPPHSIRTSSGKTPTTRYR